WVVLALAAIHAPRSPGPIDRHTPLLSARGANFIVVMPLSPPLAQRLVALARARGHPPSRPLRAPRVPLMGSGRIPRLAMRAWLVCAQLVPGIRRMTA